MASVSNLNDPKVVSNLNVDDPKVVKRNAKMMQK